MEGKFSQMTVIRYFTFCLNIIFSLFFVDPESCQIWTTKKTVKYSLEKSLFSPK